PSTRIQFTLPFPSTNIAKGRAREGSLVTLRVYDVLGREVATLVNEEMKPGSYAVSLDGSKLPSGVYFYRLQSGDFVQTRKALLMK
ncbi:MAG: T9SS type A sorting domain-containing protein, partial [Bacteroidota bacterium]